MLKLLFAASLVNLAVASSFEGDKKYGSFNLCTDGGCLYNDNGVIRYSNDQKGCFNFVHHDRKFAAGDDRSYVCVGNGQINALHMNGVIGDYCTWVADKGKSQDAALIANDDGTTYTYATFGNVFCGSNVGREGGTANQGGKQDNKFTITSCDC